MSNCIHAPEDGIFTAGELIKILQTVDPNTEVVVIKDSVEEFVDYVGAVKIASHLVGLYLQSGMEE